MRRLATTLLLLSFALVVGGCWAIDLGRPGSSDWEFHAKPVFPSLTPAPCEKEGP